MNNWQWIGAVDGGVDVLFRFDAVGTRTALTLPAGFRVDALAFDAPRNEVVALLRDRVAGRFEEQRVSGESFAQWAHRADEEQLK